MKNASTVRTRLVLLVLATGALLGCTGSHTASAAASPSTPAGASPAAASNAATGPAFRGTHYPSQGHTHLNPGEPDDFVYNSNPPTSGPHREIFNDAFISPSALPSPVQVHLVEHGNILLQYNCACPDVAAALGAIAMEYDKGLMPAGALQPTAEVVQSGEEQGLAVIVAPFPHMKSKIALTAWTRLGTLQTLDRQKIESFINLYLHNQDNLSQ